MKTYRWCKIDEELVEDLDGECVPADVAQRLYDALEYALPYLRACVPNPRNGINQDGSVDANCVERAVSALAAADGDGGGDD